MDDGKNEISKWFPNQITSKWFARHNYDLENENSKKRGNFVNTSKMWEHLNRRPQNNHQEILLLSQQQCLHTLNTSYTLLVHKQHAYRHRQTISLWKKLRSDYLKSGCSMKSASENIDWQSLGEFQSNIPAMCRYWMTLAKDWRGW